VLWKPVHELPSSQSHHHLSKEVIWVYRTIECILNFLSFWIFGSYADATPSHPHVNFTLILCSQFSTSFSGCFEIYCEPSEPILLYKISCPFIFYHPAEINTVFLSPQFSFTLCFTFHNKAIFLLYNSFWHTSVIQNAPRLWIRPCTNGTWT